LQIKKRRNPIKINLVIVLILLLQFSCSTTPEVQNQSNHFFSLFSEEKRGVSPSNNIIKTFYLQTQINLIQDNGELLRENEDYSLSLKFGNGSKDEYQYFHFEIIEKENNKNLPPGYDGMNDLINLNNLYYEITNSGFLLCSTVFKDNYSINYYLNKYWEIMLVKKEKSLEIYIFKVDDKINNLVGLFRK